MASAGCWNIESAVVRRRPSELAVLAKKCGAYKVFEVAIENNCVECIGFVIPYATKRDLGMALLKAARFGALGAVAALLEAGADPNFVGAGGVTPLHAAALSPAGAPVIRLLLSRGANPNARDGEGETPLHYAAEACNAEAARLLLERGADPRAEDRRGRTPLDLARCREAAEILRQALEQAARN
jgi:ankyrin repeat protein